MLHGVGDADGQIPAAARPPVLVDEVLLEFLYLAPVALIGFDADGDIKLANAEAARLLVPFAPGTAMANIYTLLSRVAPDLSRHVAEFRPRFGPICDRLHLRVPGAATTLSLTLRKIDSGTFMALIQDITETVAIENRHHQEHSKLEAIYAHAEDYAVCRVGLDGGIAGWNPSLRRIGGWEPADIAGASLGLFLPADQSTPAQIAALLDRTRQHGTTTLEGWNNRKDGSRFWASTVATVLPDEDSRATGFVWLIHDLTTQRQIQELRHLATTDSLTGALNRRAGGARLEAAFVRWQQDGTPLSLVMADLDHFKAINDACGHDCGDNILLWTVRTIRQILRDGDCLIRWGGEEFLLLLPDTGAAAATSIAERIRAAVQAGATAAFEGIAVTLSAGIAEAHHGQQGVNDLVRAADEALYAAKRAGRNRVATAA